MKPRPAKPPPQSPSIPGYQGSLNSNTATLAADLRARSAADRLTHPDRSRRFASAAHLLQLCAQSSRGQWGWRCGLAVCPRCECRKAKRYRERLEARLRHPDATFKHVTATIAADDLGWGFRVLTEAFADLKRRQVWAEQVDGGEAHRQVKASSVGSVRRFNLHFHAVVQLKPAGDLDGPLLEATWRALLARRGAVGSLAVTSVEKHWAIFHG